MSKMFIVISILATLGLSGCATQKELNDARSYSADLMRNVQEWQIRGVILKAELEDLQQKIGNLSALDIANEEIIERLTEEKNELDTEASYLSSVLVCTEKSNISKRKNFASFSRKTVEKCIAEGRNE